MMHFIVQLMLGFGAFMAMGEFVNKDSTIMDKVVGYSVFAVFAMLILVVEGAK